MKDPHADARRESAAIVAVNHRSVVLDVIAGVIVRVDQLKLRLDEHRSRRCLPEREGPAAFERSVGNNEAS